MISSRFDNYQDAEGYLVQHILRAPDFVTKTMYEIIGIGFVLTDPLNNRNDRSNYEYAEEFFRWMMTGDRRLSDRLLEINPWAKRFVDETGLPENFSSSYGWKIVNQMPAILKELKTHGESRRGYLNILFPEDQIILDTKTTMEYPCTIGVHFLVRDLELHMVVNMRSNNVWKVMPYDVYNFTGLQAHMAKQLGLPLGRYYHQINSAHIFKGDVRRIEELNLF